MIVRPHGRLLKLVLDTLLGRGDKAGRTAVRPMPWLAISVSFGYFLAAVVGVSVRWASLTTLTVCWSLLGATILRDRAFLRRRRNLSDIGTLFTSICFSPEAGMLASTDINGRIPLWSVRHGNLLRTFSEEIKGTDFKFPGCTIMFDPHGTWLTSIDLDGVLSVWDVASGERRLILADQPREIMSSSSIAWSPAGDFLLCSKGRFVDLWELAGNQADRSLRVVRQATLSLSSKASTVKFVDD